MRAHRVIIIAAVLGWLGAAPTAAQQHQHAAGGQDTSMAAMMCGGGMSAMMQMHAGMPGMRMDSSKQPAQMHDMMAMMGPPGPAALLQQRQKLGLTSEQVARLETLQKQAQPECAHHMQAAMTAHHAANQLLDAAAPNFTAFESKLREATTHMVEGHVVMAKAAVAARNVLTPAQRDKLKQ